MTVTELYSLDHTLAGELLARCKYPWEALAGIKETVLKLGAGLPVTDYEEILPQVWVHRSARIAASAFIGPACIIGPATDVRHCAFIRGGVLIGAHCVIGNSVELKNTVIFDNAQIPHFNYVGDSIVGHKAHLGAGAITSNVKSDKSPVVVKCGGKSIETGLKKCGAMIGDGAEIGCNSVLNPGTVIGRNAMVYPLSCVRGTVPSDTILKADGSLVPKR